MKIQQVQKARTTNITVRVPWAVCLHTTGRGVPTKAAKTGRTAISIALEIYLASQADHWGGPGYVIDYDGTVYQLAADTTRTQHVGSFGPNGEDRRAQCMSGEWERICSPAFVTAWKAAWPRKKHPWTLFPSRHPNTDLVGVEIIPVGSGIGGEPMRPGLLFTAAQHEAAAQLAAAIGKRHRWPRGWWRGSRLVGHEDVSLDRQNKGGGWDVGARREKPYFDFNYVRAQVGAAQL